MDQTPAATHSPSSDPPAPPHGRVGEPDVGPGGRRTLGVGDPAPDFTLPGTSDRRYSLADYRGRNVVLAFYPADNSPVCTLQMLDYQQEVEAFNGLGAEVLGVSPQSTKSHDGFAERFHLTFPLLSDEDKSVGRSYGVVGPLGFYRRSVFVVGPDGVLRYAHRAPTGLTFRRADELLHVLRSEPHHPR